MLDIAANFLMMNKDLFTSPLGLWVGLFVCAGLLLFFAKCKTWAREELSPTHNFLLLVFSLLIGLPLSWFAFKWAWGFAPFWPSFESFTFFNADGLVWLLKLLVFVVCRIALLLYLLTAVIAPPFLILILLIIFFGLPIKLLRREKTSAPKHRREVVIKEKIVYVEVPAPPVPEPRSKRWKHRVNKPNQQALPPREEGADK
jgi:hypothetical protein